jgi:hypothetical protein
MAREFAPNYVNVVAHNGAVVIELNAFICEDLPGEQIHAVQRYVSAQHAREIAAHLLRAADCAVERDGGPPTGYDVDQRPGAFPPSCPPSC